jgi:hypothetical protein
MIDDTKQIDALKRQVAKLDSEVKILKKDLAIDQKMAVSMKKELTILKVELQRLNTRTLTNENDIGHLRSKR